MQKKAKNRRFIFAGLLSMLMILGTVFTFGLASPMTAHAAGNTPIHSITGYEYHTHNVYQSVLGSPSNSSQNIYRSTGVQLYSSNNTGGTTSGSYIELDSTSFYVDFTNANALYKPSGVYENTIFPVKYRFEIKNSSGYTAWYYDYSTSDITEDAPYTRTFNANGSVTTKTDSDGTDIQNFTPVELGKKLVNLYNGDFTWSLSTTYMWIKYDTSNGIMAIYKSTSSMSGTLLIDSYNPSLSIKGYSTGGAITSGSYVNQRVTATASDTNFYRLYYKIPGNSYYSSTTSTSYTSSTTHGWWYVYAIDDVGNKSSEYSFYYDGTKPVGSIASNGSSIASGSYVSKSFAYTATDAHSGVKAIYYKSPVSGSYQTYASGTIIPANAGDGWYYFYAVDNAGNVSSTMSVYLETSQPLVEIYRNGGVAYSGTMTGGGTIDTGIYFNNEDTMKITYDSSSGKVTSNYTLDSNISLVNMTNSQYTITLTTPTGITTNYIFHMVDEMPYITINNVRYENGSTIHLKENSFVSWYDDSDISDSADTGVSISSTGNVVVDEFIKYSEANGKTLTTADLTETIYTLELEDRAGNRSSYTIYIDKNPVSGTWVDSEGTVVENGGYSSKPVKLNIDENTATATYSKDGGEYQSYTSGTVLSEEGVYTIVVVDRAGNKSTFTHHIDYTAPTGSLYANYNVVPTGTITNQKIYFSWDGDNTATVNGFEYAKNSVISDDGRYTFILKDKAGNTTEYVIEIDAVSPTYNKDSINSSDDHIVGKWYNVEFNDVRYSFATYESALEFACQKEFDKYVTALELTDVNNFTQYHLVASKGNAQEEVKVGTYYRYKSQANPNNELYYFNKELLNEVVAYYAKDYISAINYFVIGENQYGVLADNMFDNIWINGEETAPCINGYVFEKIDSSEVYAELVGSNEGKTKVEFGVAFDNQFNMTGLYEITEIDTAGNSSTYYVFLDKSSPEIMVDAEVFGSGSTTEMTITKDSVSEIGAYYYKTFNVKSIIDNDSWATLVIENEDVQTFYSKGDELPILNEGGEYQVSVYDRLGNSYSFTVYIVGNEATVTFTPNTEATEFKIDITLEQDFDTLVSLEIYKDGVKIDGVSTDTLNYTYSKDGVYTVVMRDNFGRVIERTYDFDKSLPNGTLSINNDSRTTEDVAFTYDSTKYYAEIFKNGIILETDLDGSIVVTEDGNYQIRLVNLNDEENFKIYTFTIDTKAPIISLTGVSNSGTTNTDVQVSWEDSDVVSSTYIINGGEEQVFDMDTVFSEEGIYVITVKDDLDNTATAIFTIDKTLDYEIYVNNSETTGVDTTNQEVTVINNEALNVTVTKNGEPFEFDFGDILSQEGTYVFKIADTYGNTTTFQIVIDKSVDATATTGNGTISNEDVVVSAGEKVNVIVTKDGQEYPYAIGQALTEEGNYKVTMYDTYGNEKTIQFQIVKGTKTELNYTLGDNVEIIEIKKDGEVIEWTSNTLNFVNDGTYEIKVKVDGKEYMFELSLDTTAPEVTLNGIEDGGVDNVTVTITDITEEGIVEVYKDGVKVDYNLGDELKDYGNYEVKVTDKLGNTRTYSFTLEYQMNGWAIALIVIGVLAIAGLIVLIVLKKRRVFKK